MMQMPPPDAAVLAQRQAIVAALRQAVPGAVIDDPAETRAYECDALSAYRELEAASAGIAEHPAYAKLAAALRDEPLAAEKPAG